jgi:hypothetical protein
MAWSAGLFLLAFTHALWTSDTIYFIEGTFFDASDEVLSGSGFECLPLVVVAVLVYSVVLGAGSPRPLRTLLILYSCPVTAAIILLLVNEPLWISVPLLHLAIGACLTLDWWTLREFEKNPNVCFCGYDLRGMASATCPKCGKERALVPVSAT